MHPYRDPRPCNPDPSNEYNAQYMWVVFAETEKPQVIFENFGRNGYEFREYLYMPCNNCLRLLRFERSESRTIDRGFGSHHEKFPSLAFYKNVFSGLSNCYCRAITECMPLISGDYQFPIVGFHEEPRPFDFWTSLIDKFKE